ncbi:MAG: TonB-dependent receptor, partial [Cyclobacteriaceae bacterium]
QTVTLRLSLREKAIGLEEVMVVSGTLKEVSKKESPVPVEVYLPTFFKRNPTSNFYEGLQQINGVRPQLNCNICNTGDIHINGLEGPYTMVLLDGMPIVSGLSTVYGLSSIPSSLVERVEIVKGSASALYGSEAVGGLINIITKKVDSAPLFSADIFGTTWNELNADMAFKTTAGDKVSSLFGVNYFLYDTPIDNNGDGFTDVTQQHRISLFNKWDFKRKNNRLASVAGRYYYEDRWGGQMNWNKEDRGGRDVYGESIYTERFEITGVYQLPTVENLTLNVSYNEHFQDAVYGDTPYIADQHIGFSQLTWDRKSGKHSLLSGLSYRYTYYNDNTGATATDADRVHLPGVFAQDEIRLNDRHKILTGIRYDHDSRHGNIWSPRFAYKWSPNSGNILRFNFGTGFRVVNLFTEDHAALTGARTVVIAEQLNPEQSYNFNLNYVKQMTIGTSILNLDASAWYTYFTNKIVPDYDTNPNQIIYANLDGHAISRGVSLNADFVSYSPWRASAGISFIDVLNTELNEKGELATSRQILAERFSGTWSVSYEFRKQQLTIDYTGNVYGPMRLPTLGDLDPRDEYSPFWSVQNIQLTKKINQSWEFYGGIKNLLNFTPSEDFLARANDPFDENVVFDEQGNAVPTANNPFGLTFDPTYAYAPNQGIRGFLGIMYTLR